MDRLGITYLYTRIYMELPHTIEGTGKSEFRNL